MENNLSALGATKIIDICISLSIWEPPTSLTKPIC